MLSNFESFRAPTAGTGQDGAPGPRHAPREGARAGLCPIIAAGRSADEVWHSGRSTCRKRTEASKSLRNRWRQNSYMPCMANQTCVSACTARATINLHFETVSDNPQSRTPALESLYDFEGRRAETSPGGEQSRQRVLRRPPEDVSDWRVGGIPLTSFLSTEYDEEAGGSRESSATKATRTLRPRATAPARLHRRAAFRSLTDTPDTHRSRANAEQCIVGRASLLVFYATRCAERRRATESYGCQPRRSRPSPRPRR